MTSRGLAGPKGLGGGASINEGSLYAGLSGSQQRDVAGAQCPFDGDDRSISRLVLNGWALRRRCGARAFAPSTSEVSSESGRSMPLCSEAATGPSGAERRRKRDSGNDFRVEFRRRRRKTY